MSATPAPEAPYFEALERRRTQALVQRDRATIEDLHAAEYELITPTGAVFSRARYLEAIAREPFYSSWHSSEFRVRATPTMAVLRYKADIGFPSGRQVHLWHTDIYQLISGRWQAVWSQATELNARPVPSSAA